MVWTPKSTAPASFNLRDAFIALITGDPFWGWLDDWIALVPTERWDTADYCARGPLNFPALDPSDLYGPTPRNPFVAAAELIAKAAAIAGWAENRVFEAYCEQFVPVENGWGPPFCIDTGPMGPWGVVAKPTGVTFPAGATLMGFISWTEYGSNYGGNLAYFKERNPSTGAYTTFSEGNVYGLQGANSNSTWAIHGGYEFYIDSNAGLTGILCVHFNAASYASFTSAVPEAPPEYGPRTTTDPSLIGIAAELDRQESKLDFLLGYIKVLASVPEQVRAEAIDAAVGVDNDEEIALEDAAGVVVTVSGVPAGLDVGFGTPQLLVRLGRVNFGTATAWYPYVPLTHSPMVIRPLPPSTTRIVVNGLPPGVTASVSRIAVG